MCLKLLKWSAQDILHRLNPTYVITPLYITSYVLFHLFSQCRTLGNATVGRQITVCTVTHCVMMSLTRTSGLTNTVQCELIISSCDLAFKRKRKKEGCGGQRATCIINEERVASPQPPVSRRGRAAVPHHTGVLVPA